jgi:hypothetical protein
MISTITILRTTRMSEQQVTDGVSVSIYSIRTRDKISTVSFYENDVFCPVVILIFPLPGGFQYAVVSAMRIQNCTESLLTS